MSDAPAPAAHAPGDTPPIAMTITWSQATIMIVWGCGMVFCAILMGTSLLNPGVPIGWKIGVAVAVAFLVWWGAGFVLGALSALRQPVFTLHADRLVCHDLRGELTVALDDILARRFEKRTGVVALVLEVDDRRIVIPETLRHSDLVFARLAGDAERPAL